MRSSSRTWTFDERQEARYDIMAFPIKMMSLDAAPVRAILLEK